MHGFTFNDIVEPTFGNSGCHTRNGILLAHGNKVKEGIRTDREIIDLAPTILNLLGIKELDYMDGQVISNIFEESLAVNEEYQQKKEEEKLSDRIKKLKESGKI